jgi:hypothetical protein
MYVRGDTTIMSRPLYATREATTHVTWNRPIAEFDVHRNGYLVMRNGGGGRGRGEGRGANSIDVFLAHLDSATAPRPLLDAAYQEVSPRISPDGRLIAYMSNRTGRFEVFVRPLFGNGPEIPVSADQGSDPVWSSDGREIFYRGSNNMMSAHVTTTPRLAVTRRDTLFRDGYTTQLGDYGIFPDGREFVMLRSEVVQAGRLIAPLIVVTNWHAGRADRR